MEAMESLGAGLAILYFVFYTISGILSLAVYVVTSLSIYTMADRRGIPKAWLAWVPIGNLWILGSLSDHYQHRALGRRRNKRKVMLWLVIAVVVLYILMAAVMVGSIVSELDTGYNGYNDDVDAASLLGSLGLAIVFYIGIFGTTIALTVIQYICYYDVFRSCAPDNAVLYLVLSIVVNICLPIFLLICRNKDDGLPRRQVPPVTSSVDEYTYYTTE